MTLADPAALTKFFIVVPPSFERVALYELQRRLQSIQIEIPPYEIFPGGIELELPLAVGLSLNAILKIPTRILLRVASRELLSFPDLEKWLKSLGLESYAPFKKVYVSTRSSRLKIKNAIEESVVNALKIKTGAKVGTDIYIRFFRDEATLSIDTSGEDLFVRGHEKWVGEAPIRDNMAAGLLQLALQGVDDLNEWEVVDPMMGSGTFLTEALQIYKSSERPFSWQNWPAAPQSVLWPQPSSHVDVRGADLSEKNVETARKNLQAFRVAKSKAQREDLLKAEVHPGDKKRLVILNPPYGKRLKIKVDDFFQKSFDEAIRVYAPERFAIILPAKKTIEPTGYEKLRELRFSNNGIDVHFAVYLRAPKGTDTPSELQ